MCQPSSATNSVTDRSMGPSASASFSPNGISFCHGMRRSPAPKRLQGTRPPSLVKAPPSLPIGITEMTAITVSNQCFFQKSAWNIGSNRLSMKPIAKGSAITPRLLPTLTQSILPMALPSLSDSWVPFLMSHWNADPIPPPMSGPSEFQSMSLMPLPIASWICWPILAYWDVFVVVITGALSTRGVATFLTVFPVSPS